MTRIDIGKTAEQFEFTEEIWAWLDLLGDVLRIQQEAHLQADLEGIEEVSWYRKVLVAGVFNARQGLNAIYLMLRFELVNQAAAQVRIMCEGLIVLRYISLDPEARARQFWEYSYIEAYERMTALIDREGATALTDYARALIDKRESLKDEYERLKPSFTAPKRDKSGSRDFKGWADKNIADQATECGPATERLYALVYKTMSNYVHGSGWALRKHGAYSQKQYDPETVLVDFAEIIRILVVVWIDLADLCRSELGWEMHTSADAFVQRIAMLDGAWTDRRRPARVKPGMT